MATEVQDLVLVHVDNKPGFYARIEEISPDVKPAWWQVKLLVLTLPLQVYHWILEADQINGKPFTMGGTPVCLEKITCPDLPSEEPPPSNEKNREQTGKPDNVISLFDRKKES